MFYLTIGLGRVEGNTSFQEESNGKNSRDRMGVFAVEEVWLPGGLRERQGSGEEPGFGGLGFRVSIKNGKTNGSLYLVQVETRGRLTMDLSREKDEEGEKVG